MLASELAEMVPTWAISLLVEDGLDSDFSSPTAAFTAWSMPRLRSIGFMPAATAFMPGNTIPAEELLAQLQAELRSA